MLEILQREEYGYMPPVSESVEFEVVPILPNFCAGKAKLDRVEITSKIKGKTFKFPISVVLPASPGK